MIKTDILTKLNRKKKTWISPKHPLFFEDVSFKIQYCAGIFAHAGLNKTVNTLNNFELERLMIKGLGLNAKDMAQVIKLATDDSRIVDDIILTLKSWMNRYIFLLDLINVSMRSTPLSESEEQSIAIYSHLLGIETDAKNLLYRFVKASFDLELDYCLKVFEQMNRLNIPLAMTELKYYVPDIEYTTRIENKSIIQGEVLRLVDQCVVNGELIVPQNSTLIIDNAVVYLYGSIIVDGGILIVRDSSIINKTDFNKSLIEVKSYSEIQIYHSVLDCRYVGSAINQQNGNLTMDNSKVYHTTKTSAIRFWGNSITIDRTKFHKCFTVDNGAAIQIQSGKGRINECRFRECEARNGGAIYVSSDIMITCCKFKLCLALQYGSAIYYNGEAKSNVQDCEYNDCYPEKEELIQYIHDVKEKFIHKEYHINISTIVDIPIVVEELGILCIEDAVVYVRHGIQCKGILELKNSRFVVDGMLERDMFDIVRARGCMVDHCEFDGKDRSSIFRATGARMAISHSLFRNIRNGRAIYDAKEPKISDTIFSYCGDGAIYTSAGSIERCTFINCRQKSGAGIIMYGSRGLIKNCRFIRCVSDYSGGGIDATGGHTILECEFTDCKPNNIA
ncbi:MAG TPA: right-handed parallel beta-helix repeat-containing protein [Lachnospiraceae bacterium]|nr:right-handed parallel beta-helix repeat-containing protein [Lachnospiraceae bacterium]